MKNNVKKFSQFVNERFGADRQERHGRQGASLVATVDLSRGMGGEFATITFNGEERSVDELESLRATWQNILDIANEMGADLIYSVEDEDIISQADINTLDDQPSGY